MKKLVFAFTFVLSSMMIIAQVPEKKKDSPPRSRGQERAINESGVSVKSQPSKGAKAKAVQPASKEEKKKKEASNTEIKKPE